MVVIFIYLWCILTPFVNAKLVKHTLDLTWGIGAPNGNDREMVLTTVLIQAQNLFLTRGTTLKFSSTIGCPTILPSTGTGWINIILLGPTAFLAYLKTISSQTVPLRIDLLPDQLEPTGIILMRAACYKMVRLVLFSSVEAKIPLRHFH